MRGPTIRGLDQIAPVSSSTKSRGAERDRSNGQPAAAHQGREQNPSQHRGECTQSGPLQQKRRTLVEIAAYPPPMGSWSLRIDFVAKAWRSRGHRCVLLNIGSSRKLKDPKYTNVRGALDYILRVVWHAIRGHVVHTHTNAKGIKGTLLALCAQLICLVLGRRCVLTFHAGAQQEYFPPVGKFWLDWLMRLVFKTPHYIICNSPAVKNHITRDYCVPRTKVFDIPAFCKAYMQTELGSPSRIVEAFLRAHEPVLVSYVFFFHPEFTVDLMLRAVERLRREYPHLGLVIMGSKQYAEDYVPMIHEAELSEHVLLTGNLPREEFLAVLNRATLYLRTPMGDGVAASVLEALAIGTPVVASDNGTRPQGCILYQAGDLDDMVNKIRYVLNNRKEALAEIAPPPMVDTVAEEVDLLLSAGIRKSTTRTAK